MVLLDFDVSNSPPTGVEPEFDPDYAIHVTGLGFSPVDILRDVFQDSYRSLQGASGPNRGGPTAPAWQLVHQRLLNWTLVWSASELDQALDSTERGRQLDECALTVWAMQCYKRYVRMRTQDHPPQPVDRLFVPPNVADAINNAVYNGRHGDATAMLKDLWTPFGFDGMPRLILALARHRRDSNHWVVHR